MSTDPKPAGGGTEHDQPASGWKPTKTPAYQAMHADRYQRQAHLKRIQDKTNTTLICYVSGAAADIVRDDVLGFTDLLHNIKPNSDLDLLLHTLGGDIDAAEKLSSQIRKAVGNGRLRVIVPDSAKSAGTLMALGADVIVMGDSSELGPIDPQIILEDANGNGIKHSVQSYLDAFRKHAEALIANPNDVAARIMFEKLDPSTAITFEAIRNRSRQFAENQLNQWMFRNKAGPYTKIAADLIDTQKWLSHGQMINAEDAKQLGLEIEYLDKSNELWQDYWQLYCLQRFAVKDSQKLFESEYASLLMDS